jgi:hypothetical protein
MHCKDQPVRRLLAMREVDSSGCNHDFTALFDSPRCPLPL